MKKILSCLMMSFCALWIIGCGDEGTGHRDDPTPGGESNAMPDNPTPEQEDAMMEETIKKNSGQN